MTEMMLSHPTKKLGKKPHRPNRMIPAMSKLLVGLPMPPLPVTQDFYSLIDPTAWGEMGNDLVGDCALAAVFHMRKQWSAYAKKVVPDATPEMVIAAYSQVTGYTPGNPYTDQGTALADALRMWLHPGFLCGVPEPEKIVGFASINPHNFVELMYSIAWMGGAYIGIQMPLAWQNDAIWDVGPGNGLTGDYQPGGWGGHCVDSVGYTPEGVWVVSWGRLQFMTKRAWDAYVDEAYCILSEDWRAITNVSGSGIAWDRMTDAMDALRRHKVA